MFGVPSTARECASIHRASPDAVRNRISRGSRRSPTVARADAALARSWSSWEMRSMSGRPTRSPGLHPSTHSTEGDTHVTFPDVVANTTSDTFSARVRNRDSDASSFRRVCTFLSMLRRASTRLATWSSTSMTSRSVADIHSRVPPARRIRTSSVVVRLPVGCRRIEPRRTRSSACTMSATGRPTRSSGSQPSWVPTEGDTHSMVPSAASRTTTSEACSASRR